MSFCLKPSKSPREACYLLSEGMGGLWDLITNLMTEEEVLELLWTTVVVLETMAVLATVV